MIYKILIAEDDEDIIGILKLYLESDSIEVISADNGSDAMDIFERTEIHLAILDIMMPKLDGYKVIKKIRENSIIPIIVISAKNLDNDKILGLDLGADDYITKPFNPLEVCARVKSLLRRAYKFNDVNNESRIIKAGNLVLNAETFSLLKGENEIILTPTEYKILALLMKSKGRVFTKVQIYESIKGEYFESDENTLMVHISKLREKVEDNPKEPKFIKTIRGLGYRFENI